MAWGYEPNGAEEVNISNVMQALMNDVNTAKENAKPVSLWLKSFYFDFATD